MLPMIYLDPLLTQNKIRKDFSYLSGEDGTALAYLAQGGHGLYFCYCKYCTKIMF